MAGQNVKIPPPLSATDKSSFAYKTMTERLPVIVVKTIDFFHRRRKDLYKFGGIRAPPNTVNETDYFKEIETEAREFISKLTRLRKELETNKPVELFEKMPELGDEFEYFNDDVELWNKSLESNRLEDGSLPRWIDSPWLLVECYLYRRLKQYSLATKHLKMFDPFVEHKQAACKASQNQMVIVADHLVGVEKSTCQATEHTHPQERAEFNLFIQLALWANKSDLSISAMNPDKMEQQTIAADIRESVDLLREKILCDNMSEVWFKVQAIKERVRSATSDSGKLDNIYIDIVADNSGYELFVDLCLMHFLTLMFCPISLGNSGVVFRLHLKRMPWYVSDTHKNDLNWLLDYMTREKQESNNLKDLGDKWKQFFATNFWEIHADRFWTLPNDYADMPSEAETLYNVLKQSSLIVFKGDLNYRKLVGDKKWHLLTPFRAALRGFEPAPLVALRTLKADVAVGIEDINVYSRINNNELPSDWMVTGDFGLIQYMDPLC